MGGEHYSIEQIDFLKSIAHLPRVEMARLFNEKYNESRTKESMQRFCSKRKLTGVENKGRLKKGHKTWNKGMKGIHLSPKSEFKKGSKPHNTRNVGDERVCSKDGFVYVKVSEEKGFVAKHRLNWGETIPDGYNITFKDGNKLNCDKSNLMLVKKSEMLVFNRLYCRKANSKNRESLLLLAKIKNELYSKAL